MALRLGKTLVIISTGLCIAAVVLMVTRDLFLQRHPKSATPACRPGSEYVACMGNFVIAGVKKNPQSAGKLLSEFWNVSGRGSTPMDLRLFSPLAHTVGMELVEQNIDPVTAMGYCGHDFKGACIHGVVMEYIDNSYKGVTNPQNYNGYCDKIKQKLSEWEYLGCVHALGHEFRAKTVGTDREVLGLCNRFASSARNACASGVFMEASKGNRGSGSHSDENVGTANINCTDVQVNYAHACYSSMGSYTQYLPSSLSWNNTFEICSSSPVEYQADCFAGADERLLMAEAGNQAAAQDICKSLPEREKSGCLLVKAMSLDGLY